MFPFHANTCFYFVLNNQDVKRKQRRSSGNIQSHVKFTSPTYCFIYIHRKQDNLTVPLTSFTNFTTIFLHFFIFFWFE